LRYVRDTGTTNSDIAPIPCSALDTTIFNPAPACTGNLLDMFGAGLGRRVRQDNNNFAPQVGFAWDLFKDGKTVLRAGAGMAYASSSSPIDRTKSLPSGLFNFIASSDNGQGCETGFFKFPTAGGGTNNVTTTPGGLDIQSQVCGQPIGAVASQVVALDKAYKGAWAAAGPQANPAFVGRTLDPTGLFAPNYRTPYSYQMNVGIQRAIRKNAVVSADYVRNVSLHYLLGIDINHVGDSRFLNKTAAQNAIDTTNTSFGCPVGTAGIQCSIGAGATIEDYALNGLTSTTAFLGGPPSASNLTPDQGAAFAGVNPEVGQGIFNFPVGRAVYNALQVSLRQRTEHPLPFAESLNLQVSYSLSRYAAPLGAGSAGFGNDDQSASPGAEDFRHPLASSGPVAFDRTHQLAVGAVIDFPKALRIALIGHIKSPLAQTLTVEDQGRAGEIFHTDFTGDGTTGDLLPGTRNGAFGRDIKSGPLTAVINKYNSTVAGTPTPAGQALVDAGLFTADQLVSLGAVADSIAVGPTSDRANMGWLKTVDLKVSFPIKIKERVVLEPSAGAYNLFNFVNYDINPATRLSGVLTGTPGSVNGTTNSIFERNFERARQGPGIFSLGTARQIEFGMRISF
jgi:hypothetical protein